MLKRAHEVMAPSDLSSVASRVSLPARDISSRIEWSMAGHAMEVLRPTLPKQRPTREIVSKEEPFPPNQHVAILSRPESAPQRLGDEMAVRRRTEGPSAVEIKWQRDEAMQASAAMMAALTSAKQAADEACRHRAADERMKQAINEAQHHRKANELAKQAVDEDRCTEAEKQVSQQMQRHHDLHDVKHEKPAQETQQHRKLREASEPPTLGAQRRRLVADMSLREVERRIGTATTAEGAGVAWRQAETDEAIRRTVLAEKWAAEAAAEATLYGNVERMQQEAHTFRERLTCAASHEQTKQVEAHILLADRQAAEAVAAAALHNDEERRKREMESFQEKRLLTEAATQAAISLEMRLLEADKIAAEAVAKAALLDARSGEVHVANKESSTETHGSIGEEDVEDEEEDENPGHANAVVWPISSLLEAQVDTASCSVATSTENNDLEGRVLVADRVAAEAVAVAAMSASKAHDDFKPSATSHADQERVEAIWQADRIAAAAVADAAAIAMALREELAARDLGSDANFAVSSREHHLDLASQTAQVVASGAGCMNDQSADMSAESTRNAPGYSQARQREGTPPIVIQRRPKKSQMKRWCRRGARCCYGCSVGTTYAAVDVCLRINRRIARSCRRHHRAPLGTMMAWLAGSRSLPCQENETVRIQRRLRYLIPPHPCYVPRTQLAHVLQLRLVVIMWIHGIGALLIASVGGGAYAAGLTWRPELGSAIGTPLSLATLAIVKGGTSLAVFAAIFQRARIPPCLAALGCAPIPLKMESGVRPLPFRVLSSQLLKRMMTAKVVDTCGGMILLVALHSSFQRANQRHRGDAVRVLLSFIAIGLAFVDVLGGFHVLGTSVHYVHFLWRYPDPESDLGWSSCDSDDDDDDEEEILLHASSAEHGRLHHNSSSKEAPALGPSMRWSDPAYAREIDGITLRDKGVPLGSTSSRLEQQQKARNSDLV